MRKSSVLVAVAAFSLGGLVAAYSLLPHTPRLLAGETQPAWSEVPWPFPIDQWGKGKAFRCKAAHCGTEILVYIRAKIGFCNCSTGVSDDEELQRISDLDLLGHRVSPQGPGREIAVAWMKGRSRAFVGDSGPTSLEALAVGFNDRCDAIIATAVHGATHSKEAAEPLVLKFLNSKTVVSWAEVTLGL
jgi:hypothetical protein